jgi:hypothetical protein
MIKTGKGYAAAAAAAVFCLAQPAQADMGCWNNEQAAAAKVRDLQSRLMVASLRCRAIGIDVLAPYNAFVAGNRTTLQAANSVLRAQFAAGYGLEGETAYDRFTTAMANGYGAEATTDQICAETADAALEAAEAEGDTRKLLAVADRLGPTPELPGGECPIVFSAR